MYEIKIAGHSLKFHKQKSKNKTRKKQPSNSRGRYKPLPKIVRENHAEKASERKKNKKINRPWNKLLSLLNSIRGNPDFFVTLIYPNHYSLDEIIDRIRDDINRFGNRFRYHHKDGWAIYSIEFKHGVNIHIHIIGKLRHGYRSSRQKRHQFEAMVYGWWARTLGLGDDHLSKVDFINTSERGDACKGYLRKADKKKYFWVLSEQVEGRLKYTFGTINKKNIPRSSRGVFQVPDDVFNKRIRPLLIRDADRPGNSKRKRHKNNLRSKGYGFHVLKHRKAIERILKKYRVEV